MITFNGLSAPLRSCRSMCATKVSPHLVGGLIGKMIVFASQAASKLARASVDLASIGSPAQASEMLLIYIHKHKV